MKCKAAGFKKASIISYTFINIEKHAYIYTQNEKKSGSRYIKVLLLFINDRVLGGKRYYHIHSVN